METRILCFLLLISTSSQSGLLEMSQELWSKLLNGGLSNIAPLDPLRVPIVKVDQSQGNISYRMVLTNVEITGLNASRLESIHIARGRVKSNLSEGEAGYVSYSDRNTLDSIRYRFHTVVKQPKTEEDENLKIKSLETSPDVRGRPGDRLEAYASQRNDERFSENQRYVNQRPQNRYQQYQRPVLGSETEERSEDLRTDQNQRYQSFAQAQRGYYRSSVPRIEPYQPQEGDRRYNDRDGQFQDRQRHQQGSRGQEEGDRRYNDRDGQSQDRQRHQQGSRGQEEGDRRYNDRDGQSQDRQRHQQGSRGQEEGDRRYNDRDGQSVNGRNQYRPSYSGAQGGSPQYASVRVSQNQKEVDPNLFLVYAQTRRDSEEYRKAEEPRIYADQRPLGGFKAQQRGESVGVRYPVGQNTKIKPCAEFDDKEEGQEGFVDIFYADEKDQKLKHFGNLKIEPKVDKVVYKIEDILRDLDSHKLFISRNFTEGESLQNRNKEIELAERTGKIEDMKRYAKEFQEAQGYFEEGMELIYHYGNDNNSKVFDGKRTKRADDQFEVENDDDIMHVIVRIQVPVLQVKAGYVLMGKVGKQVLRGSGELYGNFTELVGDFTVELKKTGEKSMAVRAARAKLEAKGKNVTLQGMDENGLVEEILTQGLLAAEAVAAMLADDLATKAINESTAEAMIYKMYKELPSK